MALEHEQQQLSLTSSPVGGQAANGVDTGQTAVDGGDEGSKTPRLPRWTRQEILVLIQGKRVAESGVRRVRAVGMGLGSVGQVEPKWATVSSYCKRHGVNRGPVQCRKRWSNLAGDYRKIKEWESQIQEETESFWVMRNDLRRERKLPGFFDREVYDILDGPGGVSSSAAVPAVALALAPAADVAEIVFDSGRSAAAEDGLFSDFEQEEEGSGSPGKETPPAKDVQPIKAAAAAAGGGPIPIPGTTNDKQPASNPETGSPTHEGRKRKWFATSGDEEVVSVHNQLIDVLERNGKMLAAQLEAQNTNFQLDREQRKNHADGLLTVLNKLADALGKIADKL